MAKSDKIRHIKSFSSGGQKYSSSFTAGGLMLRETNAVLELLLSEDPENALIREAKEDRFLRINSESARKRVLQEIRHRKDTVNKDIWKYYVETIDVFKPLLLFYMCLKTYKLVFDFHFDVTLPTWKTTGKMAEHYAYELKLDELSNTDPLVDSWKENTRRKLITVYRRMLNEAGLLISNKLSIPSPPADFWCYALRYGDGWFMEACLLPDKKRRELKEHCK